MHWQFTLDKIQLDRFEVPQEFEFGHESKSVVHDYPSQNGSPVRTVQAMGAFALPTKWSAKLYGANALSRALELDRLCTAERKITWAWGPLSHTVQGHAALPVRNRLRDRTQRHSFAERQCFRHRYFGVVRRWFAIVR